VAEALLSFLHSGSDAYENILENNDTNTEAIGMATCLLFVFESTTAGRRTWMVFWLVGGAETCPRCIRYACVAVRPVCGAPSGLILSAC
jgi:hypothetical protein